MCRLNTLPIWEVRRRIITLIEFQRLLIGWDRNHDGKSRILISEMISGIDDIVETVGYSSYATYREGVLYGGRVYPINLLQSIFKLDVYDSNVGAVLDWLNQVIGAYKKDIPSAWVRTLNPFFWISKIIGFIIGYPMRLLVDTGVISESSARNPIVTITQGLFTTIVTLATVVGGILGIAEQLGYMNVIKTWIHRII